MVPPIRVPCRGIKTDTLSAQSGGGEVPADQLVPQLYDELRALAARELRHERAGHTLQPTALVIEAYLRLAHEKQVGWKGRSHSRHVCQQPRRRGPPAQTFQDASAEGHGPA